MKKTQFESEENTIGTWRRHNLKVKKTQLENEENTIGKLPKLN